MRDTSSQGAPVPREAKLFNASDGSAAKGFLRLSGNIPPSWIDRETKSRKQREPAVLAALHHLKRLRKRRPNARATIRAAQKELRRALREWDTAYRKQCFYYGIRALLELDRRGKTRL
jgi:hypothetical protein